MADDRLDLQDVSSKQWISLALVVVVLGLGAFAVFSGIYTVEPEGKAVVKRFGKVIEIANPGLHFKIPFGVDTATFVPTERVLKEEFGFRTLEAGRQTRYQKTEETRRESLMLTGDLNVIDVEWVVQFFVRDPDHYLHNVKDPRETVRDVSEAVMRRIVGNNLGSEVLTTGRVSISNQARDEMQEILDSYEMGIHVRTVELQDVTPPDKVKPAFNEVNEARQERERLINEAEKYRNKVIPKARGEADQTVASAQAYATKRLNEARGEASRFAAVAEEYKKNPDTTRRRLYLEMIDDVLPRIEKLYVTGEEGGPLPLLELGGAARQGVRK